MLKATQFFYNAKSEIMGGGAVAPYIRLYLWGVCAFSVLLGAIGLIFQAWVPAIYTIIVALLIAAVESTFLLPPVERVMEFFLENYMWRAVAYIILCVPCFFSLYTFVAGILIAAGGLGYLYCVVRNETPKFTHDQDLESEYIEDSDSATPTGAETGLLSNYQQV
eukprot:TRINITY_DN14051_c0_g1_i1.p2 TRINITY_DN14051_c0_g1~~TRINITY_DN14051_c0_g1_i1.p2  ORF type:complete len:173 (-),score=57.07 TRINITY_DN14051_c0_g1_i1:377-871(-)